MRFKPTNFKGMLENHSLSEIRLGIQELLENRGYNKCVIVRFNNSWDALKMYMCNGGTETYTRSIGEAFIKKISEDKPYNEVRREVKRRIRHINALSEFQETGDIAARRARSIPFEFAEELGAPFVSFFQNSKSQKRSERSIKDYKIRLRCLYTHLQQSGKNVKSINADYIIQFLEYLHQTINGSVSLENTILTIRIFFRFLCAENFLDNNHEEFWMSLLSPKVVKQRTVPSVYSKVEVEQIIAAIDRKNPVGKRDYAMVLLAARYGLRISDIIGLRFCNLDWETNKIILLQQKTGKKLELPLSEEVGEAIIDYLKFSRKISDEPYVFITVNAPFRKLTTVTVAARVSEYIRLVDTGLERRRHGPHALRHSLASNLLELNEPLPVISEILGHSSTESTRFYLRVNFNQLMQCALEVPCVPSSFYNNLYE